MKDQYFGDVNDFRKYGLLRLLTVPDHLRLGVCWMLTEPDGRTDGEFRAYLRQPQKYRHHDPELFDWLNEVVGQNQARHTALIENSSLLGQAVFHSAILTDYRHQRTDYFCQCAARLADCDLVFFDPDNGLEIKKTKPGRKDSCKFLLWDEVRRTFSAGPSVLIYQHFPRQKREEYTARLAAELRQRTSAAAVFSYRTPNVLFLLASQARHAAGFRRQLDAIRARWGPSEIVATENPATESADTPFSLS